MMPTIPTPTPASERYMPIHRRSVRSASAWPALLLLAACGGKPAAEPAANAEVPPVQVALDQIAVVDTVKLESGPSLSGTLMPLREATLRAQVAGAVLALYVDEGAAVQSGTPLALIDTTGIADQARSARSMLRSAEVAAQVATRNAERSEALHNAGAIADRDLEAARAQALAAEANLADAKSRLASATKQLADATLRAPFAGVVSRRPVNVGDVLQVGGEVITVVDPSRLELEASVPAAQLGVMKVGTPVQFSVTGRTGMPVVGRIARINPAVDPVTRQLTLYIAVPNAERTLAAGLFAEGRVSVESKRVLAIPTTAIDAKSAAPSVKKLAGGRVSSVPVTLGLRDERQGTVEITAGLARGDTVLVGAATGTPTGAAVKLAPRDR